MTKPPSIARFELLYWIAIVLGWVNTAINWPTAQESLDANPVLANVHWFLPAMTLLGVLISVALWFFITRRASVVAKWIQVVFAAFGVIGILSGAFMILSGKAPSLPLMLLGMFSNILYIAAAAMLFKPDAKEWFGEGLDEDELEPMA